MEDTAVNYLDQLVQRSMIQVVERDWDGSIKSCRIHDFLRDLCLKEAREDGFLRVFRDSTDLSSMRLEHNLVRLAFHYVDKVEGCCLGPDLRSLSIYRASEETRNASEITKEMFQGLTKLRVMYLERLSLSESESLLEETKTANHLRYLVLKHSELSKLPQSFGYIYPNLQTLDVRRTQVKQLPESLGRMKTLRHLYVPNDCKLPPNIANLTNIQTIEKADASGGWIEESLAMLSSIRRLSIRHLRDTQQKDFANALRKLKLISSLEMVVFSLEVSAEYIRALSNNNHLFKLYLHGAMPQGQLPESRDFPQNLIMLQLKHTELKKDPMPTLERLPNLASLQLLYNSYTWKEMVCTAGGFHRLEELELSWLAELESWDLEDGAMPNLAVV